MDILICTDGSDPSVKAAELVTRFGFPATTQISILGVSENDEDIEVLNASIELIKTILGTNFLVKNTIRHGNPIDEILAEVTDTSYDLVVVGGGGNQMGLLHPQIGPTTGRLARKLDTHFLVVRNIPQILEKVLFCAGPDTPTSETMTLGGKWISKTQAVIGLLHVVTTARTGSNVYSGDKSEVYDSMIEQFNKQLRDAGIQNKIVPRVRQGLVVEEVLKELSEGSYQLLVIGAHYQPGQDLWQGTLLDDVTDQLLNRTTCSVLII